jgi:hypothetical protein
MKFCPVVPEICRGQVHGARKERRIRIRIRIIIIIRRNGAKTISLQTLFGRLNKKKRSKNNKSPKLCLGDLKRVIFGLFLFLFLFSFLSGHHELVHGRSQELQDRIS